MVNNTFKFIKLVKPKPHVSLHKTWIFLNIFLARLKPGPTLWASRHPPRILRFRTRAIRCWLGTTPKRCLDKWGTGADRMGTGWWFGTWLVYDFPETVGNGIIPTDSYFSEGLFYHQPDYILTITNHIVTIIINHEINSILTTDIHLDVEKHHLFRRIDVGSQDITLLVGCWPEAQGRGAWICHCPIFSAAKWGWSLVPIKTIRTVGESKGMRSGHFWWCVQITSNKYQ